MCIRDRADGVIKEVTDNGIVLENKNGVQVVNLDYVIKLREYPYNKKGKRSTIIDLSLIHIFRRQ